MKKLLTLFALAISLVCGSVGTALATDYDDEKIVQSVNTAWNAAFNSGDSETLAQLYTESATLSPGNGQVLVGQKAIAELFKSFIDNGVKNHAIETVEIYRANKQVVQLGKWHAEGVDDKQQPIGFGGILMTVLEQNDAGEWKAQSHVWNMAN